MANWMQHGRLGRDRQPAMLAGIVAALMLGAVAQAHHSFAMYDRDRVVRFTGVVTSIDPDTNHLMLQFAPMNAERNGVQRDAAGAPLLWAIEMQAASAVARYGITRARRSWVMATAGCW
jgi:hypothetical protein